MPIIGAMEIIKVIMASCLCVVENVMGGRALVIELFPLNMYVTQMKFRMEMIPLILGSIRKGSFMFLVFQGNLLPDSSPSKMMVLLVSSGSFVSVPDYSSNC